MWAWCAFVSHFGHDGRMTARIIDGRAVAERMRGDVAKGVTAFRAAHGRPPGLFTLLVGDDAASELYIRMKHQACERDGIASVHVALGRDATQEQVEQAVDDAAMDDAIDGILVQLPMPVHLDADAVIDRIPAAKDADGFHLYSMGALVAGRDALTPATPTGVMALLDAYDVTVAGANATVIGRSMLVGRPMAMMLLARDATVTITHLATRDLAEHLRTADIVVSAAGAPGLVTAQMIKPGATVIDVGTTRTVDGLRGDVDFAAVREVAGLLTPVPGGVGPMTIAALMSNTLRAAWQRAGSPARARQESNSAD